MRCLFALLVMLLAIDADGHEGSTREVPRKRREQNA